MRPMGIFGELGVGGWGFAWVVFPWEVFLGCEGSDSFLRQDRPSAILDHNTG
jgi:hypothetical protein